MAQIIECIPNFSEGRDLKKIESIADEIRKITEVKLLHIDIGYDANRTVITFAGPPKKVVEAAFNAVKKAGEVIDMRTHKGVHPRFGAVDVLPLVPVRNITMEETITYARYLAEIVGNKLDISVYCYEYAAFNNLRKNLYSCRRGEYEGLKEKLRNPDWKPDFGPDTFNEKFGAIAIGARKYLLAYNVNLETEDVSIAKKIAGYIRESGYKEEVILPAGENKIKWNPGYFKNLKAIGWYMPKYGKVQVSTNIADIDTTHLHLVYEKIKQFSNNLGVNVSGSELIGLLPLQVLIEAGTYYNNKNETKFCSDSQLVDLAIENLGLNDVSPFISSERILEYLVGDSR